MDKPLSELLREPAVMPTTLAEAVKPARFLSLAGALGPHGGQRPVPRTTRPSSLPARTIRDVTAPPPKR